MMKKLILILIYPFVYLFHPRIRRANALRIKFWAMDRDFFREERKTLSAIALFSFMLYGGLIYALPALYLTGGFIIKESFNNVAEVNVALIRDEQANIDDRVSKEIELKTKKTTAYEKMLALKEKQEKEKELENPDPQSGIEELIENAKQDKGNKGN